MNDSAQSLSVTPEVEGNLSSEIDAALTASGQIASDIIALTISSNYANLT